MKSPIGPWHETQPDSQPVQFRIGGPTYAMGVVRGPETVGSDVGWYVGQV